MYSKGDRSDFDQGNLWLYGVQFILLSNPPFDAHLLLIGFLSALEDKSPLSFFF